MSVSADRDPCTCNCPRHGYTPSPRWRKADPDEPSTWPEDKERVLFVIVQHGAVTWRQIALGRTVNKYRPWSPDARWLPWSEIGDPT